MKVGEAKDLVLGLIGRETSLHGLPVTVSHVSPDLRDLGKFVIDGRVARAIHHFSGWRVPIDLGWFTGGFAQPTVHGSEFYWYAFAIPGRGGRADHYFVCDYLQMRE